MTRCSSYLPLRIVLPAALLVGCAASYSQPAERRLVDIAAERRRCVGEAVQQCLVVRWAGDSTWGNLYDEIEGFTHVPGFRFRLVIERLPVRRPSADGSSHRYRLLRQCSRMAANDSEIPLPLAAGVAQCR